MAEILKTNITSSIPLEQEKNPENTINNDSFPHWYDPKTAIYHSKHHHINLPSDPFVDAVSYLFSHKHIGETALIDSSTGFSIRYSKLLSMVKGLASGLNQIGIGKGDVVLILLPNSIYFPVIFLSVLSVGGIVAPMNPLNNPLEIKKQTKDCNFKLVFTTSDKVDAVNALGLFAVEVPENVLSGVESVRGSVSVVLEDVRIQLAKPDHPLVKSRVQGGSVFHQLISSDPEMAPGVKINQEDTATIMFSSGTTGSCKGVMLTHRNLIAMMAHFVRFEASQYENLPSENVYLAVVPMFHVFGLSLFVMGLLSLGTAIVVMRKFDGIEMVKAIERYGVTHFPVVPPLMAALTRKSKSVSKDSLKSLKQVSSGAAPLTTKCIEEFIQALPHVDFVQGYGMTETTAIATRGYNTKELFNYTSAGLLAPNAEAKVVDLITGSYLPPGGVGELWLCTPGIMKGYLNNEEATKSTVDNNGWLHTGDIVYFDQEGYLFILDRLKEVIKYKGFQIAPADLESVLMSHPDVHDAAVTAATDEEAGEIPVAFVVRKKGTALSEASLIDYVAKNVAPYKKVRKVYFTTSIPKSASGKIIRRELKNFIPSRI